MNNPRYPPTWLDERVGPTWRFYSPIWGLASPKRPICILLTVSGAPLQGEVSLTRDAEIENESSLSAPACEIPLGATHRYADFTMKILVAFVLPLVVLGFAIAFAY